MFKDSFVLDQRVFYAKMLETHEFGELTADESSTLGAWSKALFDSGSEGIEDAIIRKVEFCLVYGFCFLTLFRIGRPNRRTYVEYLQSFFHKQSLLVPHRKRI